MQSKGDGLNHLRKRWVEASLELAKLRACVVQRGEVVDFAVAESRLEKQISAIESQILGDGSPERSEK